MSLEAINGVPASMSTSRSSTTRASSVRDLPWRVGDNRVSPTTDNGVRPSACIVDCELLVTLAPMYLAREALIILVSAPVSIVRRKG